jgi:hypothetical protein
VASEQAARVAYLSISRAGAEPASPPQTLARGEGEAKIVTVEAAAKDLDGKLLRIDSAMNSGVETLRGHEVSV